MISIIDKHQCCGCSACANICSQKAINMVADSMGFHYPVVDQKKCVECGLCLKVCDFHTKYKRNDLFEEPLVFGCRHKNEKELSKSQSGALAYALAEQFISEGGVVYGAVQKSLLIVEHCRCTTMKDIQKTRYSKYIQSITLNAFKEVKRDLLDKKNVLFFGTPCQVSGLRSFLGKKMQERLFTCDLVCHGVPSPAVWANYCEAIEKKTKGIMDSVIFRDKKLGWHSHSETFSFTKKNGKRATVTKQTFRKLFYSHLIVRSSCSVCPYTNLKRVGDITCGDFWGWEKYHPEWNDNKGVSLALINSDKGYSLFQKANIDVIKSKQDECIQPQLLGPITLSPLYDKFVKDFECKGFVYVAKKYADWGWKYRCLIFVNLIKRFSGYNSLRKMLKR